MDKCPHENFSAQVDVNRLTNEKHPEALRFCAEVRIVCMDCGIPMRFIGLPTGLDLNGAAVNADATEGRFAIAPKGEVVCQLDDDACPTGFTMRRIA
jgi:hypothetical protein